MVNRHKPNTLDNNSSRDRIIIVFNLITILVVHLIIIIIFDLPSFDPGVTVTFPACSTSTGIYLTRSATLNAQLAGSTVHRKRSWTTARVFILRRRCSAILLLLHE